ncbi:hypothetical protein ACH49X_19965 [Nocardia sp. NPDC019323]|uniref:hypothetical protein n=1 Tax=Nocardia sp. NPDC019323 TaxID=3364308 RepID=UPI003796111B
MGVVVGPIDRWLASRLPSRSGRTRAWRCVVDDLDYHRYWVPEHHGMSGVASAAPAVVVERIASLAQRIRVGHVEGKDPQLQSVGCPERYSSCCFEASRQGRLAGRNGCRDPAAASSVSSGFRGKQL